MQRSRCLGQIRGRSLAGCADRQTDTALWPPYPTALHFQPISLIIPSPPGVIAVPHPAPARSDLSLGQDNSSPHPLLLGEFNFHSFLRFARLIQPPLPLSESLLAVASGRRESQSAEPAPRESIPLLGGVAGGGVCHHRCPLKNHPTFLPARSQLATSSQESPRPCLTLP